MKAITALKVAVRALRTGSTVRLRSSPLPCTSTSLAHSDMVATKAFSGKEEDG